MERGIDQMADDRIPGMIEKAASLKAYQATDDDLKAINNFTLNPLKAEDVYTFKAVLCDNETDRQFERFNLKALQDLKKLFLGKTVIKDHYRRSDNQIARIYATELEQDGTKTVAGGELYTRLAAKCYMVRTAGNADLIREIDAGIRKEGSVGFSAGGVICSICGVDNAKKYCPHWPGEEYDNGKGAQTCTFLLDGARDAYEFSLVAVPAQRAAGVSKSYTGETVKRDTEETEKAEKPDSTGRIDRLLMMRARRAKNFENEKEE